MDKEKEKKEEITMNATVEITRPCSIAESIKRSCKEVKLMREGKSPKRSWKNFADTIREEIAKDE